MLRKSGNGSLNGKIS